MTWRTPLPRARPVLAPQTDFERHRRQRGELPVPPGAAGIAQTICRKHTAGRAGERPDGAAFLAAFRRPPDPGCNASQAIGTLLHSLRPHDLVIMMQGCGLHPADVARHLRANPQQPIDLVRFLNQFAARPATERRWLTSAQALAGTPPDGDGLGPAPSAAARPGR